VNNKGQFSIIAALFVTVILISSVMVTYSAIRYGSTQDQPQIISAMDETNLALKQVLGFTVGYYGSILQVTGNSSYAYAQSSNYLNSGLANIANMNPQWGTSFNITALSLDNNWFTNASYSEGNLNITYDLTGLGVYGIAYSASCRLDVQISTSSSNNQVCLTVIQDENEPVVDLSMSNFKFYLYRSTNSTWAMVNPPDDPISSSNGTYTIDIPSGITYQSYIIQVRDSRGIMVSASSFSHVTGSLTFNTTTVSGGDYVSNYNSSVDSVADQGTHSNFTAQQQGPDNILDTLTEQNVGTQIQDYFPDTYSTQAGASLVSGGLSNLNKDDYSDMSFQSYASAYSPTLYSTIAYDNSNSTFTNGANSLSWKHTTGTGNDRILLVSVDTFNYNAAPSTVNSVSYGSTPLTASFTAAYSSNPQVRCYVFYLVNPSSGTNTITVNFASSTAAVGGSTTYYNVNQASPILASNTANGSGSSQSVTLSASGTYSKLLYGSIAAQISSSYTLSDAAQQTNRWSDSGSYKHGNTNYYYDGKGSDNSVTSGSVGLSWTSTHSVNWVGIAILLQPTRLPTQETCQIILSGSSDLLNWNSLIWAIDASSTTSVGFTLQLFNYNSGQYATSGDGYLTGTLGTANYTEQQTITVNPGNFRDNIGRWQLYLTTTASASSPFIINLDLARYRTGSAIYAASLEEQWINLNSTVLLHPALCIDTGAMGSNNLAVDAWYHGSWQPLSLALVSGWNNISVNSFLDAGSTNFTIRFRNNDAGDNVQTSWQVDAALLRPGSDQDLFLSLQNPAATVAVELLQNGTLIWLGQNLQVTTQTVPVPPVPVKAIHINETIDGVNQQVPFQIEDWASSYTVPLGLTNNATVFGNRQMIVFLVNTHVTDFTLWWNGSDQAIQTPLAYADTYFTSDKPSGNLLSNGQLSLQFSGSFVVTSTVVGTGTSSTASFMRINNQPSTYGSSPDWVVVNGVVRDIVQQEAEWSNGITNCSNLYANIVLTLPANATYFTYQLNLMFINSQQNRTISDLCPIALSSSIGQLQTENGTLQGEPVVASGTQTFNSTGTWGHHWSQFTNGTKGAGIMFTDQANQMLYVFDNMTSATARGALKADSSAPQTISLLPVTLNPVSFQTALDVTWYGAVVTFDGSAPSIYGGDGQPGMWILAEMPPTITVNVGN
jgi:hypothetical protein